MAMLRCHSSRDPPFVQKDPRVDMTLLESHSVVEGSGRTKGFFRESHLLPKGKHCRTNLQGPADALPGEGSIQPLRGDNF